VRPAPRSARVSGTGEEPPRRLLGEHPVEVLLGLLGLTDAEIGRLSADGMIRLAAAG
jgi:hypothetical protein